jgi:hypothetical protein
MSTVNLTSDFRGFLSGTGFFFQQQLQTKLLGRIEVSPLEAAAEKKQKRQDATQRPPLLSKTSSQNVALQSAGPLLRRAGGEELSRTHEAGS